MERRPLTTGDIAAYCHVTDRAVLKWIEEGKLKAYRTPGSHSRVNIEDFLAFLKEYNMPIPKDFERDASALKKILVVDDDRRIRNLLQIESKELFFRHCIRKMYLPAALD